MKEGKEQQQNKKYLDEAEKAADRNRNEDLKKSIEDKKRHINKGKPFQK